MGLDYNFDEQIDRRGTHSCRWTLFVPAGREKAYGDDYIYLACADMDFTCSNAVKRELQKVVDHNVYGYTILMPKDSDDYYDAVLHWFRHSRGWELKKGQVFYTPGSTGGARMALRAFTKPGDGVIINHPVYGPFHMVIEGEGRNVVNSQLFCDETGYYSLNFEELEELAARDDVTAYLLCSPHNPVGRVWTEEELKRIHDICRKHNVLILSDEVHCDFVWTGNTFKGIAQVTDGSGIVTLTGFGKTFNLAAMEPANAVITDEALIPAFARAAGYMMISPFTIAAVKGACLGSDDWLCQVRAYIEANLEFAVDFLKERMPKVRCRKPEGGYMLWMDFSAYGFGDEEIHRRIYEEAQVILEDGTGFDPVYGKGWQRACIPLPRKRLEEALERIAKVF